MKRLIDALLVAMPAPAAVPSAPSAPVLDAEQQAAIAQLNAWLEGDATDDPEEIRQSEQEYEELKRNLNANRAATGEQLVFP